jgi:hypothetical protein
MVDDRVRKTNIYITFSANSDLTASAAFTEETLMTSISASYSFVGSSGVLSARLCACMAIVCLNNLKLEKGAVLLVSVVLLMRCGLMERGCTRSAKRTWD